jgi:hypothetical protein
MIELAPLRGKEMKLTRWGIALAMSLIGLLTLATMQRAFAVATVPNAVRTTFTVPYQSQHDFALAAANVPIHVMISSVRWYRASAEFNVTYSNSDSFFYMTWAGVDGAGYARAGNSGDTSPFVGMLFGPDVLHILHATDASGHPSVLRIYNQNSTQTVTIVATQIW